ncbi:GNAT family N-acetyltransferase [Microbacterium sp. CFH 31415]|uniref:GNAT family N-acetyltransferase n=1 Tax=Microbacterium sp. CFH 31415 TaxID=2921732 RepID=UPI001F137360|nr:GNAT family N-acetyltransferase [Microbacterium sp. CFH 31415]MCH6230070.1 GNAT family N-acetyltransferase [Microbacterium sp. CFH 31415]
MSDPHVRRVLATDGNRLRALRLEALQDPAAGIAFLESYDEAVVRPADFWEARAIGAALSGSAAQFIAEAGPAWVGTLTILIPEPSVPDHFGRVREEGTALAVAVYVSPSHRGHGVVDALMTAGAEWARHQGCARLLLDVHQDNARAQAAYRRLGFTATGSTIDGQNGRELEMARALSD